MMSKVSTIKAVMLEVNLPLIAVDIIAHAHAAAEKATGPRAILLRHARLEDMSLAAIAEDGVGMLRADPVTGNRTVRQVVEDTLSQRWLFDMPVGVALDHACAHIPWSVRAGIGGWQTTLPVNIVHNLLPSRMDRFTRACVARNTLFALCDRVADIRCKQTPLSGITRNADMIRIMSPLPANMTAAYVIGLGSTSAFREALLASPESDDLVQALDDMTTLAATMAAAEECQSPGP